jgi:hypothetical protein
MILTAKEAKITTSEKIKEINKMAEYEIRKYCEEAINKAIKSGKYHTLIVFNLNYEGISVRTYLKLLITELINKGYKVEILEKYSNATKTIIQVSWES